MLVIGFSRIKDVSVTAVNNQNAGFLYMDYNRES